VSGVGSFAPTSIRCGQLKSTASASELSDGQGTSQGSEPSPGVGCSICGACHKAPPSFARCVSQTLGSGQAHRVVHSATGHVVQRWRRLCRIPKSEFSDGHHACGGRLFRASLLPCRTPSSGAAAKETGMTASLKIDEPMARRKPSNCFALCLCGALGSPDSTERLSRGLHDPNKRSLQNDERAHEDFLGHFGSVKG
jgi:hypothetical protein